MSKIALCSKNLPANNLGSNFRENVLSKLLEKRKRKKCFKMFFQSSRPIIFTVLDKILNLKFLYSEETRKEKSPQ